MFVRIFFHRLETMEWMWKSSVEKHAHDWLISQENRAFAEVEDFGDKRGLITDSSRIHPWVCETHPLPSNRTHRISAYLD